MPKKKPELDEQIELAQKQKKETFVTKWFKDTAVNNRREMKQICDLVSQSAYQQFSLHVPSDHTEIFAVVFYATFEEILAFCKSRQKNAKDFTLQIANSINIGYTNDTDEDNEKVGNFTPILEFIGVNRTLQPSESERMDPKFSTSSFIQWKELNGKLTAEYYNEIQNKTYDRLRTKYRTNIRYAEAVIPLFCTFMDYIGHVLKQMYREAEGTGKSEVALNVFGLFDIFYSFNEDENREYITFAPGIPMKTGLKNDEIAAAYGD